MPWLRIINSTKDNPEQYEIQWVELNTSDIPDSTYYLKNFPYD